ncbi:MAG TPA: allantoicase [Gemmatimonadota bacterium]|nr:allantoicase [Gemmatimonadota bacterium]
MVATNDPDPEFRFEGYPDLAGERLGGVALAASDEFFAPKENLLVEGRARFDPDRYTDRGKWMDGWESRRKRGPGHDWVVVRLGAPGVIHGVNVDTSYFRGNHPERASVEACAIDANQGLDETFEGWPWITIVPPLPLAPDADNRFPVRDRTRWTHVRLNIVPDGGVARFRVHGVPVADPAKEPGPLDLAAVKEGGLALAWSDARFGPPHHLLLPDRARHMGDGWETRRRRGPGHDWVVIRLGMRGVPRRVVVETTHFKGNYPESFRVEGLDDGGAFGDPRSDLSPPPEEHEGWREIVPLTALGPDAVHDVPVAGAPPVTHVRLSIHPDGGVARFRVYGDPAPVEEMS